MYWEQRRGVRGWSDATCFSQPVCCVCVCVRKQHLYTHTLRRGVTRQGVALTHLLSLVDCQSKLLAQAASLLMGPAVTVGGTFAVSILFAGVAGWIAKDSPQIRDKSAPTLYLLDLLDTLCDWASWTGTSVEGDFTFSNDQNGIIKWTLCAISILSTVLFFISTSAMLRFDSRLKFVSVLGLGLENFKQSILYIIVATSQANTSTKCVSVFVGIVQAICFCVLQVYELKKLES